MSSPGLLRTWPMLFLAILVCSGASAGEWDALQTIPLDEIRPGMKGITKTVFSGTQVEELSLEVVDVVRDVGFDQDAILVRSDDPRLVRYGIVEGMSGSPVYIEGKLAGAVAFSWMFSKEPIAGVTPIAEMLEIPQRAAAAGSGTVRPPALTREGERRAAHRLQGRFLREYYERMGVAGRLPWYTREDEPARKALPEVPGARRTPVWVQGMDDRALAYLGTQLQDLALLPLAGAAQASGAAPTRPASTPLEPGSVVGVRLADGDVDITAIGTVTARMGDAILALGHGFLFEGEVDLPMVAGRVNAIIPSMIASFKVGTALETVGRFRADMTSGLYGTLGEEAPMIPVEFRYEGELGKDGADAAATQAAPEERVFRYRVANHPRVAAELVPAVAYGLSMRWGRLPDENTVSYSVRVMLAGHPMIRIEDVACGPESTQALLWDLSAAVGDLFTNPFEETKIEKIEVSLGWRRGMKQANIKEIRALPMEVRAGEDIDLEVTLVPFREDAIRRTMKISVPKDTPSGPRVLVVGDARTALEMRTMENVRRAVPESVDEFVALVNEPRDRRRIGAWLARDEVGVALAEGELPNLPGSVLGMISGSGRTGIAPLLASSRTSIDTEYIVTGRQTLIVTVKDGVPPKQAERAGREAGPHAK
ncbi:MAG: SpoIVB peptidase S55 domain-containing protein [Planctomycetota bacterium]